MTAIAQPRQISALPPTAAAEGQLSTTKARKMGDTFINMLGEFVALNKTPDFKLSHTSNRYLAHAIRDEIRAEREKRLFEQNFPHGHRPWHSRTGSTNSAYHRHMAAHTTFSLDPNGGEATVETSRSGARCGIVDRRQSLPAISASDAPPTMGSLSFFERVRRLSTTTNKRKDCSGMPSSTKRDAKHPMEGKQVESVFNESVKVEKVEKRRRSDSIKSQTIAGIPGTLGAMLTSVEKVKERRHHSASCRHRRPSAGEALTTGGAVGDESAKTTRKAARARKQKVNLAMMIADIDEE